MWSYRSSWSRLSIVAREMKRNFPPAVRSASQENRTLVRAIYQGSYHWNEIIYCIKTAETPRPSRERETGVTLSVYWNSQIRGPFAPLSPDFLSLFYFPPRRPASLSRAPQTLRAIVDALLGVLLHPLSLILRFILTSPAYSKLNCRYLSNVEINKPLTFL
jgi:hypothetical protein